jgi:hypothetical protein
VSPPPSVYPLRSPAEPCGKSAWPYLGHHILEGSPSPKYNSNNPGAEDDLELSVITAEVEKDMAFLTQLEQFVDEL